MKGLFVILGIVVLLGCTRIGAKLDEVRQQNRTALSSLNLGMSKATVLDIMGVETKTLTSRNRADGASWLYPISQVINNPYRTSAFVRDSAQIEVLYYYTDLKNQDGAITDDELTPIVIINGELAGWGWDYWDDVAYKYEIRFR